MDNDDDDVDDGDNTWGSVKFQLSSLFWIGLEDNPSVVSRYYEYFPGYSKIVNSYFSSVKLQ